LRWMITSVAPTPYRRISASWNCTVS
jgi:hypothetical protein